MKLHFGQSYFLRFDSKLWDAMQPYPPLGTLYAAAYMREKGHEITLFDAMLAESEAEWATSLDEAQPDIAILYEDNFNYLSKMCLLRMREAAHTMIASAKERGLPVIMCGADVTDHAESYLRAGANYIIRGEGEGTLAQLIAVLAGEEETAIADIRGLTWLDGETLTLNPPRPLLRDLDALPFPAWDFIDIEKYRSAWMERHGYYSVNMVTTRGCPYHCNWCAKPIWGQRYHSRSPEHVVAEQVSLIKLAKPDHIWFADDIMGLKPKWWRRYAQLVEENDCRIPFKSLSRADLIVRDETDIAAIAAAGCKIIWMGAESGSQTVLDGMEKGTTVEQIYQAAEILHKHGIKVGFFLQFGYPGETREEIDKTFKMVRDCAPDDVGMSVSYPLPGTKFYERVKMELGDKQNWEDSADLAMMYRGPFVTEFYRHLHVVLHKEFRSQKAIARWKQLLRKPTAVRGQDIRELAATLYRKGSLPAALRKLDKLAALPHETPLTLLPHMSYEEAARPSPQE